MVTYLAITRAGDTARPGVKPDRPSANKDSENQEGLKQHRGVPFLFVLGNNHSAWSLLRIKSAESPFEASSGLVYERRHL